MYYVVTEEFTADCAKCHLRCCDRRLVCVVAPLASGTEKKFVAVLRSVQLCRALREQLRDTGAVRTHNQLPEPYVVKPAGGCVECRKLA
jgi:hypothetical protein